MPYADRNKQKEYDKLRMRRNRHSKLDVPNKTILEQLSKRSESDE